jgi:hypothetical protein
MQIIEYDPTRQALLSPESRSTVFVAGKNHTHLQIAVEAARLAYVRAEHDSVALQRLTDALGIAGFSQPRIFTDSASGSAAYGAYRPTDGLAMVAFRGTQPEEVSDIATDIQFNRVQWQQGAGTVHAGFAKAALALMGPVQQWLQSEAVPREHLMLTGHSLGAALATLLATVFQPAQLVTIGSPRVGDRAFAASFGGIDSTRFVDCCDAVTEIPPEGLHYSHVTPMTYISRAGVVEPGFDSTAISADRSSARAEYLIDYAWKVGNVIVRDLADHAPINYVRAVF